MWSLRETQEVYLGTSTKLRATEALLASHLSRYEVIDFQDLSAKPK